MRGSLKGCEQGCVPVCEPAADSIKSAPSALVEGAALRLPIGTKKDQPARPAQ
jgi:hypothetical protein